MPDLIDSPLFDLPDGAVVSPDMAALSAGGRRRIRQAEAVAAGVHPLALVVTGIRMHPGADRDAKATDRPNLPLRCGSCWYRGENHYGYPKCGFSDTRRTCGDATTVRAWWPACVDYSGSDPTMGPDAARHVPEAVA